MVAGIERMPSSRHLGLIVVGLAEGHSVIEMPVHSDITFDGQIVQAGYVGLLADYAAVSAVTAMLPTGWVSSTTGFQIYNLEPARGEKLVAIGKSIRASKGGALGAADVFAVAGEMTTLVATGLATCRLFQNPD
jgi:uncharacterized protein (TIGR00369 family)